MAGLDGDATSSTIYIDDLIATNPESGDAKSQGDDHLRFIKKVLKNTFPNIAGPVTPTETELNTLDGVVGTLTAAELNMLDGIGTTTVATQLAAKAPTASPTFTGTVVLPSTTSIGDVSNTELAVLNGITASTAELNILDGVTATTAELNILVGVTASAAEINLLDGKTLFGRTQADYANWASGTPIDLTGVPAGASRVTLIMNGLSLSGTDGCKVQLGTGGVPTTTGYVGGESRVAASAYGYTTSTDAGFIHYVGSATRVDSGVWTFQHNGGNVWFATWQMWSDAAVNMFGTGYVALAGALDMVRVDVTGTNTIDAGGYYLYYE